MNSSMRATINRDLDRTFKNQYFERMGTAVKLILQVLNSHGFEEANVFTQQDVNKEKGHLTYQIAQKTDDPFSPVTVTNTMLVLQYGKAGDRGRYEVVTYLS
jgi:predicted Zn-dependent peptidase